MLFFIFVLVLILSFFLFWTGVKKTFSPANFSKQPISFEINIDRVRQSAKISVVVAEDFKQSDNRLQIATKPSQYLLKNNSVPLDFSNLIFLIQETEDQDVHFWKGMEPYEVVPYLTKGTQITLEYHNINTENVPSAGQLFQNSPTHIIIHNYLKSQ